MFAVVAALAAYLANHKNRVRQRVIEETKAEWAQREQEFQESLENRPPPPQ